MLIHMQTHAHTQKFMHSHTCPHPCSVAHTHSDTHPPTCSHSHTQCSFTNTLTHAHPHTHLHTCPHTCSHTHAHTHMCSHNALLHAHSGRHAHRFFVVPPPARVDSPVLPRARVGKAEGAVAILLPVPPLPLIDGSSLLPELCSFPWRHTKGPSIFLLFFFFWQTWLPQGGGRGCLPGRGQDLGLISRASKVPFLQCFPSLLP